MVTKVHRLADVIGEIEQTPRPTGQVEAGGADGDEPRAGTRLERVPTRLVDAARARMVCARLDHPRRQPEGDRAARARSPLGAQAREGEGA